MKLFLLVVGWLLFVLALVALANASTLAGQGVAAVLLVAGLVALGAGAICARLESRPAAKPALEAWDAQIAAAAATAREQRSPANAASKLPATAP